MDRRGFLKMLAGGVAAVGAAFALPHTNEGAVTAPVARSPLADAQPLPEMVFPPMRPTQNILSWETARPYALKIAGPIGGDVSITNHTHTISIPDSPNYDLHGVGGGIIPKASGDFAFPDYDENWPIYERGRSLLGVRYGTSPKPSGDLVDW